MKHLLSIGLIAAVFLLSQTATAQRGLPVTIDAAAGFTAIRANAQPGSCGCFFMSGGSAEASLNAPSGLGLLINFGTTSASNINGGAHDLRLTTYLAGARYSYYTRSNFIPFAQATAGIGQSSTNFAIDRSVSASAYAFGGGLDYDISRRFSVRLVQAEFLRTHISNGLNNEQNQLRFTTGIVLHITRPKRNLH